MTHSDTPTSRPRIAVALDGPASSGKSSVGAAVAQRLGMRFLDTGLIYRALTGLALREGIAPDDGPGLVALIPRFELGDDGAGRLTRVLLDGADATDEMHGPGVDAAVSVVARQPDVRAALLDRQRRLAAAGGIILAGRDIGTVVLPDAPLKVFLDASVEERALRRIRQRGLDPAGDEAEAVREQLRARDAADKGREVAPLRAADDAVVVTTDGMGFDAVVDLLAGLVVAAEGHATGGTAANASAPVPARAPGEAAPSPVRTRAGSPSPATGTAAPPQKRNPLLDVAMRLDNNQTILVRMVARVSRWLTTALVSVRVEGLQHLPAKGAVIIALNHASNLDALVSGPSISESLRTRRIHWLGKKELFDWPVFGWLCAHGGVHPVDRSTADVEAYRLATRILELGYVLWVFPEGTRSPDGALQEAKDGMAQLAIRTGALIVPVGINGADLAWAKGRKLPSPIPRRRVVVRIGEPFRAADVVPPTADRRAAKAAATTAIMGRIAELLEPRQRGFYAAAVRRPDGDGPGPNA